LGGERLDIYTDIQFNSPAVAAMALDPKLLDDLAKKLAEAVPAGLRDLKADAERNFRAVLQSAFTKLELVSREEFDVQSAVLARTRERLEELATRLKELESALEGGGTVGKK
jgi:ubiquinone biosynthesis accessory factor UbiK